MIEDRLQRYIDSAPPADEDIDSVREAVYAQFGPDYCVMPTHVVWRMITSYFLIEFNSHAADKGMDKEAAAMMARIHGGMLKGALLGAGFGADDAGIIVKALAWDSRND